MLTNRRSASCWVLGGLLLSGCVQSSPPAGHPPATTSNPASTSTKGAADPTSNAKSTEGSPTGFWEDYPDVPKIEIMTDVDKIKIPRVRQKSETLTLGAPIPADVGNELAKRKPSEPVTGDTLTVRFNSEPKVLNPITENSAVKSYILQMVLDGLARQNMETFEYEPSIASSWVIEDSVKLSPNYPGRERQVTIVDSPSAGQSGTETPELNYVVPASTDGKPADGPKVKLKTTNKDGQVVPHVWVGIYPAEKIVGASTTGYHYWSDEQGELTVGGFPAGRYLVRTGDEVFGHSAQQADGSLKVTPGSKDNPLKEAVEFKAGEWQDVQAKTFTTFYLRDDVKWSDGAPFTSKDIEFAYALLNSPYVDGDAIRTYYSDLIECKALGPYAIRMRYRQQYFLSWEFTYSMTAVTPPWHFFEKIFRDEGRELTLEPLKDGEDSDKKKISVVGQEFGKFFNTDDRYNSKPLGTGPYIIDKWERKDRVELVRNPHYWDTPKAGHLDRIVIKFIPDPVTALAALRAGEIDFFYRMVPDQYFDDWPTLGKEVQETYVKGAWYSPGFSYIGWNQLAEPFKDRRVRLALTMLFNRQEFIDKKLHGAAALVSGYQYIFGTAYDHDVAPIAYDPDTARTLLADAGWVDSDNDGVLDHNGEKFQVTLRFAKGSPTTESMCEILQKNCKDVGIDLRIQMLEWASFIDKLRAKECDAVALAWSSSLESDPYQIWHSSGAARENRGSNSISFRNTQADELIELMRVTLDQKKRFRIHQSFHRLLDSEQPYLFLWTPMDFGAYHRRFRNVKWYRLRPGFDLTEWYVPKDEQLHK